MSQLRISESVKSSAAFFDVDDTLITIKSMFDFFPYWTRRQHLASLLEEFNAAFMHARAENQSRSELNRLYYQFFAGQSWQEMITAGQEWFQQCLLRPDLFRKNILNRLLTHQLAGDRIVLVSGSMSPLLQPLLDNLAISDLLCVQLVIDSHGLVTGEINGVQTIGKGKAIAMQHFANTMQIDLAQCYAYGDDRSDLDMLSLVGHPVYVGDDQQMITHAMQRQWECLP